MRQTLLALILILLIAATVFVWYSYIRTPHDRIPVTDDFQNDRLAQYRQLKNSRPDTSILSDPLFQSLTRYRPANEVPALTPGRANPFLPF